MKDDQTSRAKSLRAKQTRSEGLLWGILRAKQVCGLKFRRQHPIGAYFADFACLEEKLIVEIDGGYHDQTGVHDLNRESCLRNEGWNVLRFSDVDVEQDAELVARGIAKQLGLNYSFHKRKGVGSGSFFKSPPRADARPSQREGEKK